LAYAGLPRIDSADAYRLYLAEVLLDRGMPPRALMKELGIDATWLNFNKFDPDQPRDAHGRWTDESAADNRIVVAAQDKKPDHEDLNERAYEQRRLLGLTAPEEDAEHGYPHSLPEPLTAPAEVPKMSCSALMVSLETKANFSVTYQADWTKHKNCLTL